MKLTDVLKDVQRLATVAGADEISEEAQAQIALGALAPTAGLLLTAAETVDTSLEVASVVSEVVAGVFA